ncbi:MAG TPA: TetR family transcriptional regulator, partial [Kribbella sp.]
PDVEPALTARLLFGMVNSLVEWLRPASTHTADELADAVTAAAFDGLRIT